MSVEVALLQQIREHSCVPRSTSKQIRPGNRQQAYNS